MDLNKLKQKLLDRTELLPCGCWRWQGATISGGYGHMTFEGQHLYVHRASWLVHKGPVPEGLYVLHSCDYRACINPDHLFAGTQKDNIHDMITKGRDDIRNGAILTEDQARQIKQLATERIYSQREIGEMFGVSRSTVLNIHLGHNWRHLWGSQ